MSALIIENGNNMHVMKESELINIVRYCIPVKIWKTIETWVCCDE